jgi:hypothetical protein
LRKDNRKSGRADRGGSEQMHSIFPQFGLVLR